MALDLYKQLGDAPPRADERFHLQAGRPYCEAFGFNDWLYRRVEWYGLILPEGNMLTVGHFTSYILLWFFRWFTGTVKCDGTRTFAYQNGVLGEPYDGDHYVMTTTKKELFSVRVRRRKPDRERWDNMGGI